jgi:hypothetical protein
VHENSSGEFLLPGITAWQKYEILARDPVMLQRMALHFGLMDFDLLATGCQRKGRHEYE